MKKFRSSMLVVSILLIGTGFSACNKSGLDNSNPNVAGLMAVNLAPDKTVFINISGNILTNSPLGFNNYTGGYLSIYPGNRSVESYDYGSGDSIAAASFDFEAEKYYSVFVVGSNGTYQNVIVNDVFDSLSTTGGNAYIRYINAINGSVNPAVNISANGSDVVNANAAFASVSDFVAVMPGAVDIAVNEGTSINASRTITTEENKVYTVLLIPGATSSDPAQIKYIVNGTLEDDGQRVASSSQANSTR